jgi:multidrug efflux pump subunit AcrB
VAVAAGVREALTKIQETLPEGMLLQVNFDSTRFIEESVAEIRFELLPLGLLTALVCWLFLGSLSSTLNVVLAIPMSLLGTVAIVYFLGFTLNVFTLLALALAVGIVVDDAIMVLENIVRHAESGKDRVRAAREGTQQIVFAALAATLAVVAIFIPVVFMQGIIGRFFLQFGVTLCLAVLLSYVEAITLAPARCAQFLDVSREKRTRVGAAADRAFSVLEDVYAKVLGRRSATRGRWWWWGSRSSCSPCCCLRALPGEFVPSQDQSRLMVRLQTAVGSSLEETDAIFHEAERVVYRNKDVDRGFAVVGGGGGTSGTVNAGIIMITLVPPGQREESQNDFAARLRKNLNGSPVSRPWCRTSPSRASRPSAASRWSSRCGARTGTPWWPRASASWTSCATAAWWWTSTPTTRSACPSSPSSPTGRAPRTSASPCRTWPPP